jgi:hypothetical protein
MPMFNLDTSQRKILRITAVAAGALWLCSQIADSILMERVWHQLTILTLCVGALRVWGLGAAKRRNS